MSTSQQLSAARADLESLARELEGPRAALDRLKEMAKEKDKMKAEAAKDLKARKARVAAAQAALLSEIKRGGISADEAQALQAQIDAISSDIKDMQAVQPDTGSLFVRMFLGQVNVKVSSPKDRNTLRDEYGKFKDRTNIVFIVAPLIWLLTQYYLRQRWAYTTWIYTLTHLWLLYYYVSLALRENILRVNGSSIRGWWLWHHYLSACMSMLILTWPSDSKVMESFLPTFTLYFLYQGVVQFAQAWYQKARLYARTAMGKAAGMDLAHTETLTEFHSGIWAIVGLVVIAQGWQVYNGARLFMLLVTQLRPTAPIHEYTEEMQCAALGGLFIFLGCANFVTTVRTLLEKGARQSLNKLRRSLASASGRLSPSGRGLASTSTSTSTSTSSKEGAASGAGAAPAVDSGSDGSSGFVAAGTGDGLRQRTKSPSRGAAQ